MPTSSGDGGRWLIVGLGNPGPSYAATRHNAGFLVVDLLAERLGARFKAHHGRADVVEGAFGAPGSPQRQPVVLAKPKSYMNESGGPVASMRDFFKVPLERIVVVHDELDLPFGALRLKLGGGDNGHNGLRSVTKSLGGPGYLRIRFGIGRPPGTAGPGSVRAQAVLGRAGPGGAVPGRPGRGRRRGAGPRRPGAHPEPLPRRP